MSEMGMFIFAFATGAMAYKYRRKIGLWQKAPELDHVALIILAVIGLVVGIFL